MDWDDQLQRCVLTRVMALSPSSDRAYPVEMIRCIHWVYSLWPVQLAACIGALSVIGMLGLLVASHRFLCLT